jgi:hypothetical protein
MTVRPRRDRTVGELLVVLFVQCRPAEASRIEIEVARSDERLRGNTAPAVVTERLLKPPSPAKVLTAPSIRPVA